MLIIEKWIQDRNISLNLLQLDMKSKMIFGYGIICFLRPDNGRKIDHT
jgi:hypothetical protein